MESLAAMPGARRPDPAPEAGANGAAPRRRRGAPAKAASAAPCGLVHVNDQGPGITRHRRGGGFTYRRPDGTALRDAAELARIRKLAIPPAYTRVWICPDPDGHIQATGRDARGRKQYRYHAAWRSARDAGKFCRMLEFGVALPRIRAQVVRDLRAPIARHHVPRAPVLAALVRLLDATLVRIGNEEYARANGSYGLTTLRNRHVRVTGDRLQLRFKGKSGVAHQVDLDDPRVARVVRGCQGLPGQELFQFEDAAGGVHGIGSSDVNAYLRAVAGEEFTAKDFRTWHASAHALALLDACAGADGAALSKVQVNAVLGEVAGRLRNTVAVCRKSYVHPTLLELAAAGALQARLAAVARGARAGRERGLSADERRLLRFLHAEPRAPRRA